MTKYTRRKISGDAGQYLVAYTVTKELGWPCRLLDVDLGLDGEFEVLDDDLKSDGDIIKFQVKSVAQLRPGGIGIHVDDNHIKYWKNFSAPIIICLVDHSTGYIYWKQIFQSEPYLTAGVSKKIQFGPHDSKLNSECKKFFRSIVMPIESKDFSAHLSLLRAYLVRWQPLNSIDGSDDAYLVQLEGEAADIKALVRKLQDEAFRYPWRFSPLDRSLMDAALRQAVWVIHTSKQASVDWSY